MAIPLPGSFGDAFGKGIDTGSTLFQRMIQPVLERKKMEQQAAQYQQDYGLRQQKEQRLAEMHPFQVAQARFQQEQQPLMMDALKAKIAQSNASAKKSAYDADPQAQFKALQEIMSAIKGGAPTTGGGAPTTNDAFQGDPILAQFVKKTFGVDPNHETPGMKQERDLDTFQKKINLKNNAAQDVPTQATVTANQKTIQEVNSVMPLMNKLVEEGGEKLTAGKTAADAKYLGRIKRIADVYMKAKGWPNTDTARNDAIALFKRGFNESPAEYKERMEEIRDELVHERNLSSEALKSKNIAISDSPYEQSEKNKDKQKKLKKGIDSQGAEWEVMPEDEADFIEAGGRIL